MADGERPTVVRLDPMLAEAMRKYAALLAPGLQRRARLPKGVVHEVLQEMLQHDPEGASAFILAHGTEQTGTDGRNASALANGGASVPQPGDHTEQGQPLAMVVSSEVGA